MLCLDRMFLINQLDILIKVVEKSNEFYKNVVFYFNKEKNLLELMSKNNNIVFIISVPDKHIKDIDKDNFRNFAVDCHKIKTFISESTNDEVTFKLKDENVHLVVGKSKFKAPNLADIDTLFLDPISGQLEPDEKSNLGKFFHFKTKGVDLKNTIKETSFSMLKDSSRYTLNSLCLKKKESENFINVASTDGKRMSVSILHCEEIDNKYEFNILFPDISVNLLDRILYDFSECIISIKFNTSSIVVEFSMDDINYCTSTRLSEGRFPKYEDVIPRSSNFKYSFNRIEMIHALKQSASVFSQNKSNAICLDIYEDKTIINDKNDLVSIENISSITLVENIDSEITFPYKMIFNIDYLLEALKVSTFDDTECTVLNNNTCFSMKISENTNHYLMPISE